MPTLTQAIAEAAQVLRDAGVGDERLTAGLLLGHVLGIDRTQLLIRSNEALGTTDRQVFLRLIERRAAGEPLQYITGRQEFYGLDFLVTPDVLIPRPETEFLVERVIDLSRSSGEFLVVDVGTGSGCIAVTLARHIEKARVVAIDVSEAALAVAAENAARHGVAGRIEFLKGDLLAPLGRPDLAGQIDCIASNPPYISPADVATLQREVKEWEPHRALFADEDGLGFYRRLLEEGPTVLKPGAHLVCEIGYAQVEAITRMLDARVWQLVDVTDDLQSIPRTLTLRKRH